MSVFKDKVLLITGGTGSFGNAVLNRFLRTDIGEEYEPHGFSFFTVVKISTTGYNDEFV